MSAESSQFSGWQMAHGYLRHSGIMHFSASVVSVLHMDPSAGVILIILYRFFIPMPQLALHSSHSPHSVTRQLLGAIYNVKRENHSLMAFTEVMVHLVLLLLIRFHEAKSNTYHTPHLQCISQFLQ